MSKVIIAFCEGQHDIAFLSKILLVNGFQPYDEKIKDFIKPLNEQFKTKLPNKKIGDKKLGFQSEYIVPSLALSKGKNTETLVLFHNLGGDGNVKGRKNVLSMYKDMQSEDDDFTNEFNLSFRFLYFFDADDKGVSKRVNELNEELNLSDKVEHNKNKSIDSFEWGCYIFHKNSDSGDLEDILLGLMEQDNEDIFKKSKNFISPNPLLEDRQKEFNSIKETYSGRIKFKEKKSIISIAGQLQFSGMSNAVIISKSDYIKKSDIDSNTHCMDILELFQKNVSTNQG